MNLQFSKSEINSLLCAMFQSVSGAKIINDIALQSRPGFFGAPCIHVVKIWAYILINTINDYIPHIEFNLVTKLQHKFCEIFECRFCFKMECIGIMRDWFLTYGIRCRQLEHRYTIHARNVGLLRVDQPAVDQPAQSSADLRQNRKLMRKNRNQ